LNSFWTNSESPSLNLPIGGGCSFYSQHYRRIAENDICQIEKKKITFTAKAVHTPVVSEQQKLRQSRHPKSKTSADAAVNGTQSRMAPLNTLNHQISTKIRLFFLNGLFLYNDLNNLIENCFHTYSKRDL
jgi:hypothetical protein